MLNASVTVGQLLMFLLCGMICGAVYNCLSVLKKVTNNNLVTVIVADLMTCLASGIIFIIFLFKYKNGAFELFEVVFFAVGVVFLQIFIKNLFARPILMVYNKVTSRKKK